MQYTSNWSDKQPSQCVIVNHVHSAKCQKTNPELQMTVNLTNKEAKAVYYTVIKYNGYLRTRSKRRKHES